MVQTRFFKSFMKDNVGVSKGCPWKHRRILNEKVLDTDKSIIIDAIANICNTSLNILVEMVESKIETKEEEKPNEEEKDHPLLDDAINIFKGKIIS